MYTLINSINLGIKASTFVFTVCINSLSGDDTVQKHKQKSRYVLYTNIRCILCNLRKVPIRFQNSTQRSLLGT